MSLPSQPTELKPPTPAKRIRLLLVDDHQVVRAGTRTLLDVYPEITIVGEAATQAEAITQAERLKPDVILMDVRLPDGTGIEACRMIRNACPTTRVLFLTSYDDEAAVFGAIAAGADGFLLKEVDEESLVRAIEAVAGGQLIFDPAITQVVLSQVREASRESEADPSHALTAREGQILRLLLDGRTNKEIGATLDLSEKTVRNYLTTIFEKLHVSRRTEALARYANLTASQDESPKS